VARCTFRFPFTGPGEAFAEMIHSHLSRAGATVSGSGTEVSFVVRTQLGRFGGRYSISEQTIVLEIVDKPFLVPCAVIEARLVQYFQATR
jgi:hypothetical protein